MKIFFATIGFYLMTFGNSCFCQARLPKLVSDGMILQRDTKVKIWGWASSGEKINIDFNGHKYYAVTATNGEWQVILSPIKAGGPYTMEINASNHITLHNILAGDVWLCSGQSNMVLPMKRVEDRYANVIAHADNKVIRQFVVPDNYVFTKPVEDVSSGHWEMADSMTVLHFTATGYFFAKTLYEKYHVPIGLIVASVGGTPVESWMSEDALKSFPDQLATAIKFRDDKYRDSIKQHDDAISNDWYNNIYRSDKGLQEAQKWYDINYDAGGWQTMQLPGYWDEQVLNGLNGVVWFRKEINLSISMTGKPAKIVLGAIVDRDSVYVNGVFAGTTGYRYPPRKYNLPAGLLKEGKNIIVIRVINNSGKGGFVKDKSYKIVAGEESVDLQGSWQYKPGAALAALPTTTFVQYQPLGLFNGMIAPIMNYAIRGVIWYQGEANTSHAKQYQKLFPAMISDWRKKWFHQNQNENAPFLFVQLANFMETNNQPAESNWAELREAQLKTMALPNTGMAVAIDIGEWNDIHPLNKEDVGKRLASAAEKLSYGDNKIIYSGPIYHSMKMEGNKIIISFSHIGSGLVAKGGTELKYFAIAGSDKKFVWAKARIAGDKIIVWSDEIARPVAVRYAWADNPEGANLYNKEGLPASPFRTDD